MRPRTRHAEGTTIMARSGCRLRPLASAGLAVVGYVALRRWFLQWGATEDEVVEQLPGDDLLDAPTITTTRAVTIDVPARDVWPWLIQMGQDRAGLYSYDWLENLCGLQFHNGDQIVADWQHLEVGDQIRAAPASAGPDAGFTVVAIDPGRSIVTAIGDPAEVVPQCHAGSLSDGATWTFVLRDLDDGRARLIVRLRARFNLPGPGEWIAARLLEPVHFVMERKQLLGIRQRAAPLHGPRGGLAGGACDQRLSPGADQPPLRSSASCLAPGWR